MENNFEKNTYKIVIVVLFALLAIQRACTPECKDSQVIKTTDTVETIKHDTIKTLEVKYLKGKNIPGDVIYLPSPKDSNLCDYIRVYKDTLKDSTTLITSIDSVRGQRLSMQIKSKYLKQEINTTKTITITNTIDNTSKWILYGGAELSGNKENFGFSPSLYLGTQKNLYGAGYDVINKTYQVKLGIKLFKSRPKSK